MDPCWQTPCRNSRCAQLSPLKTQSISHCFPSIWKTSLQCSHKQSDSMRARLVQSVQLLQGGHIHKATENLMKTLLLGPWAETWNQSKINPQKLLSVLLSPSRITGYLNENNMSWQHGLSTGMAAKQPHAPEICEICSSQGAKETKISFLTPSPVFSETGQIHIIK